MQLKYRGCPYTPNSTAVQTVPSNATLTYRGAKYQRTAKAPQFATPQSQSLTYRGSMYFSC